MRNLAIGYMLFVAAAITIWIAVIPTQERLMERLAEQKMDTVVRALQSEILSRFSTVDIQGNLSTMIYTYHNATVTGWDLLSNRTSLIIYFDVTSHIRVKRFGMVIDEHDGPAARKSIVANLVEGSWRLDTSSVRDLE